MILPPNTHLQNGLNKHSPVILVYLFVRYFDRCYC